MGFAVSCGSKSSSTTTAAPTTAAPTETTTAPAGKKVEIGVFVLGSANTWVQALVKGINEQAAARGNVNITVFDGQFDPTKQVAQIEDAIATKRFDGFIVMPVAGGLLIDPIAAAIKAGIKVVATNNPIGANVDTNEPQVEGLVGSIVEDNNGIGKLIGGLAAEACKANHASDATCEVAYLSGGLKLPLEITKRKGFDTAIAGTNLKVVAEGEAGFLVDQANTLMQDYLQAHPGIDVVVAGGDEMALGAENALKDAKKTNVQIIGVGGSTQGVEAVAAGRWYATAAMIPFDEGKAISQMLFDALDGKPIADNSIYAEDLITTGKAVTKENASKFSAQWSI